MTTENHTKAKEQEVQEGEDVETSDDRASEHEGCDHKELHIDILDHIDIFTESEET